jgi:cell volume regulation protein A
MQEFGVVTALVSGAVLAALIFRVAADRLRIPAPVVFLLAAAVASDVVPPLRTALSPKAVGWIASVALIIILFNGGVILGWRHVRAVIGPVAVLGVGATAVAAGVMTVAAQVVLGLPWASAAVLGVALAPTDPAVVFSVFEEGVLDRRSQTMLEAESGANDPISIALMAGVLGVAANGESWGGSIGVTLLRELGVGLVVGVAGAWLAHRPLKYLTEPRETLQPIVALAAAGLIFGVAAAAHGSGFLAVFVAGILIGDSESTVGREVRAFQAELADLAEVVVFVALGLTVRLAGVGWSGLWEGVLLAAVLMTLARGPFVVCALAPFRVPLGERVFLAWAGLRGAVPILLGSLALVAGLDDARRIYGLVFVIVAVSVLVQGSTIPLAARRLGVTGGDVRPVDGAPSTGP